MFRRFTRYVGPPGRQEHGARIAGEDRASRVSIPQSVPRRHLLTHFSIEIIYCGSGNSEGRSVEPG